MIWLNKRRAGLSRIVIIAIAVIVFQIGVVAFMKQNIFSDNLKWQNDKANQNPEIKSINNDSEVLDTLKASRRKFINCLDKEQHSKFLHQGAYWMLKNYVKASRYFACDETITYTTNGDFSFFDNIVPLLERWQAPMSIAVWAPRHLFDITLSSIAYLRNCAEHSELVEQFATFHVFFETQHMPQLIPSTFSEFEKTYVCPTVEPFLNASIVTSFKKDFGATFPINVARNLARESALTHFVLASDIELYPSLGIVDKFLAMVEKDPEPYLAANNVFPLAVFEVESDQQLPTDRSELAQLFKKNVASWFHFHFCVFCHMIPYNDHWFQDDKEDEMRVFASVKRRGRHSYWEPFYIGTNEEPLWDERLDWEGKANKMQQAYMMCLLDYNFNVLTNSFLVHKPGIKTKAWKKINVRKDLQSRSYKLMRNEIEKEAIALYGHRDGCNVLNTKFTNAPIIPGTFPPHLIAYKPTDDASKELLKEV